MSQSLALLRKHLLSVFTWISHNGSRLPSTLCLSYLFCMGTARRNCVWNGWRILARLCIAGISEWLASVRVRTYLWCSCLSLGKIVSGWWGWELTGYKCYLVSFVTRQGSAAVVVTCSGRKSVSGHHFIIWWSGWWRTMLLITTYDLTLVQFHLPRTTCNGRGCICTVSSPLRFNNPNKQDQQPASVKHAGLQWYPFSWPFP